MRKKDFKRGLCELLVGSDIEEVRSFLAAVPPRRSLNPIISLFYSGEPLLRWRAVSAFGFVVGVLMAQEEMERARVAMRRMMWSLNDESGGIGWGAPEAMSEAMTNNEVLAEEYHRILLSYVWEEGNFLEHGPLRAGALWGIARVSEIHADMMRRAGAWERIRPYLDDEDTAAKSFAVWAAGLVADAEACPKLSKMAEEREVVELYRDYHLRTYSLSTLALEAMQRLDCRG